MTVGEIQIDEVECTFLDDYLQLEGAFPDGVSAGINIEVKIIGFRNPILANKDYDFFTLMSTGESIEDLVDLVDLSIRVTEPATLSYSQFSVHPDQTSSVGIVQEINDM